ncbi:MAG: hypothetical protein ACMUEM_06720 [Flavobacteriales bacterium AspAUS03]
MCYEKLNLFSRAYDRILRMDRTIADLDEKDVLERSHLTEVIQYQTLDKGGCNETFQGLSSPL